MVRDAAYLASNESPFPPHPAVLEAAEEAMGGINRYPDPSATLLRQRIAERYGVDPRGVAVGNGSCEILLTAAHALCEQDSELIFAWPSFSIYPHLALLAGLREVRVPLCSGDCHDLKGMAAAVGDDTRLVVVCNPNNPTGTFVPLAEIAAFCEELPPHVTVILDEAYIEFQTCSDPDDAIQLLDDFPNLVLLRTFSKCHGLAGLRVGFALGSREFCAAVDAVRQPFLVNRVAQAAAAEAVFLTDYVKHQVEAIVAQRDVVEEGLRDLGLKSTETEANFSWIDLGDAKEEAVVAGLAERLIFVRAGTPLGGPGHIRVTYGTKRENQRLLGSLRELI